MGCLITGRDRSDISKSDTRTPFVIFVPMRVTKPFTLSERKDDKTSVEPGSTGASSFTHSSKPSFNAAKDDCKDLRYHWSSFC